MFLSLGLLMAVTLIDLTSAKADGPVYKAVGNDVVLTPGSEVSTISSITWKHNSDIAMEFFQGHTDSYRQFKVRGKLNVSTGALTITNLTRGDSGNYIAEINNRVTSQTQLLVIAPVSKPLITKVCNHENTQCTLTCNSSITNDGPVTYLWFLDGNEWKKGDNITITKMEKHESIYCQLSNPVSSINSDQVENLFPGVISYLTALILIPVLLVPLVSCIVFYVKCKSKLRKHVNCLPFKENQNHAVTDLKIIETTEGTDQEVLMPPKQEQNSPVAQQHNSTVVSVEVNHVQTSSENHVESELPGVSTEDPGDTNDILTSAEPQHDHSESGASTDGLGNQETAAAAHPETSSETEKSEVRSQKSEIDKNDLPEADQDSVTEDKAQG